MKRPDLAPSDAPIAPAAYDGLELYGFVPCVPFYSADQEVEEGVLLLGSRRMRDVRVSLDNDLTLTCALPNGTLQVFPKGLAALLFRLRAEKEAAQ